MGSSSFSESTTGSSTPTRIPIPDPFCWSSSPPPSANGTATAGFPGASWFEEASFRTAGFSRFKFSEDEKAEEQESDSHFAHQASILLLLQSCQEVHQAVQCNLITIAESLKSNGVAIEKSISTSTVVSKLDGEDGWIVFKAQLAILLGKAEELEETAVPVAAA
ncbi:uncharacterized protein LOC126590903 [Malus sylvestris]|uniref:uncharacterized protein LOC126590903 n=1 Tax=Malus sylvestris TaxID=3752 RepID=UPI0021ABE2E7|nr:uncharacterized protein LOC126590903 [Malus sylvestris]